MTKAAVICEFNPFHYGHKFLLEKIKANYADKIVCIMSGSFVQRGDIAITDKFTRTRAALENGADMVVELPTVYALSGAQIFARSGVQLAYELGCDVLCFGAENSIEELYSALEILDAEETQERIAARMHEGCYYPRALAESVGEPYAGILSQPNNILALEYIRACRTYEITPVAIPRKGAAHDSPEVVGDIASATAIREMILSGADYTPYTPMEVRQMYCIDEIEPTVRYLLRVKKPEETADIAGISEGLNNRIYKCAQEYNSVKEILSAIKTKRYTMARLRRAALCICLGVTAEIQNSPVPYIRVLGVKREATGLICSGTLPLIVDVRRGYDALDISAKEIFDIDINALKLMNSGRASGYPLNDFDYGVIKV